MIPIDLKQLPLFSEIQSRSHDSVAIALTGALIPMAGDASDLLDLVRHSHPSFTSHNLQHSWRVAKRASMVLDANAIRELSSVEIFSFLTACAFHDTGMAIDGCGSFNPNREHHHQQSAKLIEAYFSNRLRSLSEYSKRLSRVISFVALSHNLDWDAMAQSREFQRVETVLDQCIRTNLLCVLLRLGDLLDLDADRNSHFVQKMASNLFSDSISKLHHDRSEHVEHFHVSSTVIEVSVRPHSREEHILWSQWFGYIRQDIEKFNT